ncbi:hypothetical protein HMN09_00485500 [Mycena chlorophos]|uniref:Uncharacterized protein n=1 Tax=Mycena chlorophos TaxID=658473 RepID=A0A8H6RXM0_MYCCL|nr:hypothetical protein HMN09_01415300 [Mycena chlorophos]KAF7313301.1 hypothetical protein HMN09_00485500 [Mycena chlorophos]
MLYLFSAAACLFLLVLLTLRYRESLLARVPEPIRRLLPATFNNYQPLATWQDQMEAGLSSNDFDLAGNLAGDSRAGLDEAATREVHEIMRRERVNFDEARLIRHKRVLRANGIDPETGMPMDAKAVTRL